MELIPFEQEDFCGLYDFMAPLWHATYDPIIPSEQVTFLLEKYFSDTALIHFQEQGYTYLKLMDGGQQGVVVICEKDGATYLDKFYLKESSRGKGYPAFVFSSLLALGRDITLNVNQNNERALGCYQKNGFFVEEEQLIDLGGGMINCDFRMRLTKKSFAQKMR